MGRKDPWDANFAPVWLHFADVDAVEVPEERGKFVREKAQWPQLPKSVS